MAVEALELGEEADVEREAIEDADGVVRIDRRDEPVAGVLDGLQVPRRNVAGDAGDREVAVALQRSCIRGSGGGAQHRWPAAAPSRAASSAPRSSRRPAAAMPARSAGSADQPSELLDPLLAASRPGTR